MGKAKLINDIRMGRVDVQGLSDDELCELTGYYMTPDTMALLIEDISRRRKERLKKLRSSA